MELSDLDKRVLTVVNKHSGLTASDVYANSNIHAVTREINLSLKRLFNAGLIARSIGRVGRREVYLYEPNQ